MFLLESNLNLGDYGFFHLTPNYQRIDSFHDSKLLLKIMITSSPTITSTPHLVVSSEGSRRALVHVDGSLRTVVSRRADLTPLFRAGRVLFRL